jgi:hypothetical protein
MHMSYVTYSMWHPPPQIVSQGDCVVIPINNWHLTTLTHWHRCHGQRCRCRNARKWTLLSLDIGMDADDGDCVLTGTPETAIGLFLDRHLHVKVNSDEVYEHIIFDPENDPHVSPATIPRMFDKTLTLSSSGMTFSCTAGWKVGWAIGPPSLVKAMTASQQWCIFSRG